MPRYLEPTAPIAPAAVLTDEPKGAMDLAVALTDSPRMSNLAHGLWGYHGTTEGGHGLTIQSLGIGGPSAYAVVSDLAKLGVRRIVRIGSCISLAPARRLGSVVVATRVEPRDGIGRALCEETEAEPSEVLTRALVATHGRESAGVVRSVDLLEAETLAAPEVAALDLSSGAVAAAASGSEVEWACALVVAASGSGSPMARDALDEALLAAGRSAEAVLARAAQASVS